LPADLHGMHICGRVLGHRYRPARCEIYITSRKTTYACTRVEAFCEYGLNSLAAKFIRYYMHGASPCDCYGPCVYPYNKQLYYNNCTIAVTYSYPTMRAYCVLSTGEQVCA
jgi:hypothetical protein